VCRDVVDHFADPAQNPAARKPELLKRSQALDDSISRIVDAIADGGTIPALVASIKALEGERADVDRELAIIGAKAAPVVTMETMRKAVDRLVREWKAAILPGANNMALARQPVRQLTDRIELAAEERQAGPGTLVTISATLTRASYATGQDEADLLLHGGGSGADASARAAVGAQQQGPLGGRTTLPYLNRAPAPFKPADDEPLQHAAGHHNVSAQPRDPVHVDWLRCHLKQRWSGSKGGHKSIELRRCHLRAAEIWVLIVAQTDERIGAKLRQRFQPHALAAHHHDRLAGVERLAHKRERILLARKTLAERLVADRLVGEVFNDDGLSCHGFDPHGLAQISKSAVPILIPCASLEKQGRENRTGSACER
jgi:hypothetical protein